MKKLYQKPMARKINFNFEKVVAQSVSCESGIVLKMAPGGQCGTHTPSTPFGPISAASLDPTKCGWQSTNE